MGSIPSELSLDCGPRPTPMTISSSEMFVPRSIVELFSEVSKMDNVSEKVLKLEDYKKRLEDEMGKIDAFKRELPLSMILLTDTIMAVKMELIKYEKVNPKPVLEEFIPLKKSSEENVETKLDKDSKDKMNWMSSVQLWNHDQHSPKVDSNSKQIPKFDSKKRTFCEENQGLSHGLFKSCETRNVESALVPFKRCSNLLGSKVDDDEELPRVPLLSLDSIGIKRTREDVSYGGVNPKLVSHPVSNPMPSFQSELRSMSQHQASAIRKQRRCWSPELHRRFVEALHKLGGCQVATPKQIRELMQVDGLTNDEVKSHLQKYRLHTRRVPATIANNNNHNNDHNDEAHVILGSLWMAKDKNGAVSRKHSNSQSDSPQSPLNYCGGTTSMTGGDSLEDEDSESHSWKSHVIT